MTIKNQGTIEIVVALIVLFLVAYNVTAGVTLAILALVVFGYLRMKSIPDDLEGNPLNPEAIKKRRENLDKIMELARTNLRLTNKIVTESLKVSEATATRYFEYLVTLRKLTRINDRGREVYYQLPQK